MTKRPKVRARDRERCTGCGNPQAPIYLLRTNSGAWCPRCVDRGRAKP